MPATFQRRGNFVNPDELKADAMKLSPEAHAQLAHALLLSLEELSEEEIETLWVEEAIRREAEIDAGTVVMRSAGDVFRDAYGKLR
jgi:hypothetical protein